ncbi:hypothetical protein pipiens_005668 [Culex pipiens pipiens]|uniref:Uncharacterized protein n=1 Tax=Culex pipiens pipiens TaxID=38569 RepID=A0ABD1DUR2_CULPP
MNRPLSIRFLRDIFQFRHSSRFRSGSLISRMLQYNAEFLWQLGPEPLSETSLRASPRSSNLHAQVAPVAFKQTLQRKRLRRRCFGDRIWSKNVTGSCRCVCYS